METQIIRQSTHKASKTHECKICRKEITKGTSYVLTVGKWDGRFDSIRNHSECIDNRKEYLNDQKKREGCGEWAQSEF